MAKRGCLGCSFPLLIGITVAVLALFIIGLAAGPLGRTLNLALPEWIPVPQPEPHLPAEEVLSIFHFPIANSVVAAWFTVIVLTVLSWLVSRRMKLVPGRLQSAFEFLVGWLYSFCARVAGEKNGRKFFPVVATIFLFVSFNSWLSLLPGFGSIKVLNPENEWVHLFRGANTDINMPLALALASFFFVEFFGLRTLGIKYLGKFINVGPFIRTVGNIFRGRFNFSELITSTIGIAVGLLETLSELIRIVSFTFRLFGNMTAGEILLLIAMFLAPYLAALPFYGLELLVGFVQALIFGGLTLVFLTLATAGHGEGHGPEAEKH